MSDYTDHIIEQGAWAFLREVWGHEIEMGGG